MLGKAARSKVRLQVVCKIMHQVAAGTIVRTAFGTCTEESFSVE